MAVLDRLKDLYGVKDQRGDIIALKLTHSQIANYASVSRETVTRALKRLENDAAIQILENKFILLQKLFFDRLNNVT